jgi:hypothetical protein
MLASHHGIIWRSINILNELLRNVTSHESAAERKLARPIWVINSHTGAANFSASGPKRQHNVLIVIEGAGVTAAFNLQNEPKSVPPLKINFRSALLSRPDRCRNPAFYGFVLYAMARPEAWHLALPKYQASTTRRWAASRWKFYRQIGRPRRMGDRPSNREHADRLRDNDLCRCISLVYVLQLLIEIIQMAIAVRSAGGFTILTSCLA